MEIRLPEIRTGIIAKLSGHAQCLQYLDGRYTFTWCNERKSWQGKGSGRRACKYVTHIRYDSTILFDPILLLPRPWIYFRQSIRMTMYTCMYLWYCIWPLMAKRGSDVRRFVFSQPWCQCMHSLEILRLEYLFECTSLYFTDRLCQ